MKKKYGVCAGMLAMGLAVLGAPASKAQSRMAAGEAASSSVTTTTSEAATPAAASPSDLDRRIEALETELLELKTELETKKEADAVPAVPAVVAAPAAAQDAKPPGKDDNRELAWADFGERFRGCLLQLGFQSSGRSGYLSLEPAYCAFDCRTQSISLNMIELILDKAPDATAGLAGRTGYHFSVGYGDSEIAINSAEAASSGSAYYHSSRREASINMLRRHISPISLRWVRDLQVDRRKICDLQWEQR